MLLGIKPGNVQTWAVPVENMVRRQLGAKERSGCPPPGHQFTRARQSKGSQFRIVVAAYINSTEKLLKKLIATYRVSYSAKPLRTSSFQSPSRILLPLSIVFDALSDLLSKQRLLRNLPSNKFHLPRIRNPPSPRTNVRSTNLRSNQQRKARSPSNRAFRLPVPTSSSFNSIKPRKIYVFHHHGSFQVFRL